MTALSCDPTNQSVVSLYQERFGDPPNAATSAPGRVNLLGEHTDYNGGYVLPTPLDLEVSVAIGYGPRRGAIEIYSRSFDASACVSLSESASGQWTDFVLGAFNISAAKPKPDRGYRLVISSTLPMGAGISSSAALEVASLRAINALLKFNQDPVVLALAAQRVERGFVGAPCGIMDQFTSAVGELHWALFLDTHSFDYRLLPLFDDYRFVVVHSGVSHKLTDGGYGQRVAECQAACLALGVSELREVSVDALPDAAALPDPMNRRVRHIVTENERVLAAVDALEARDPVHFGELMMESHLSQRDDYAVSIPEIDELVALAIKYGAIGARLTGGGFGGSIVALVAAEKTKRWIEEMRAAAPQARVLASV